MTAREFDELRGDARRDRLTVLVERHIALGDAERGADLCLAQSKPVANLFEGAHGRDISRPDSKAQQSDCFTSISLAHIVRRMAAKDLSPEQRTEAVKLKAAFKEWQARRRERGEEWQQDAAAHELGFGQSALSQYLGGLIPLNQRAVAKFSALLGVPPIKISPIVVRQAREAQERAAAFLEGIPEPSRQKSTRAAEREARLREALRGRPPDETPLPPNVSPIGVHLPESSLRRTKAQKSARRGPTTQKRKPKK